MKEGLRPNGQEVQIYEKKRLMSSAFREKTGSLLKTARKKTFITAAGLLAAASVGLAGCGVETQSPLVSKSPTSAPTSAPTPEPTPTLTFVLLPTLEPTLIPTKTPTLTPTRKPTETPTPAPTLTPTPEPTLTPEPTPTQTPEPIPTPTPTPAPEPTLTPTPRPTPEPTPTQVPIIKYEPGMDFKLSKCFTNSSTEYKRRSIDLEFTEGNRKNIKIEVKVDKTQKEIEKERIKNPDKNVETEKIISEGSVFEIHPGDLCADFKVTIRSGASPDCYKDIIYNFRSREGRSELLDRGSLIQNVCIVGTLQGSFDERSYEYDSTTNTVTAVIVIDNPANIAQQTKFGLAKPCSFLEVAEREIRENSTDSPISPNQPQTIPKKNKMWYIVKSILPFGKKPTFPLTCTVKLDPVLEK